MNLKCHNCGAENPMGKIFCQSCGEKLDMSQVTLVVDKGTKGSSPKEWIKYIFKIML